jgi:hypothetical protein
VEKSIQKQISRLAYGSLEMTPSILFYTAISGRTPNHDFIGAVRFLQTRFPV